MTITTIPIDGGKFMLALSGEITAGDAANIGAALTAASGVFAGFSIDSPGGSVVEAERVAYGIRATAGVVLITKNAMCASACFLLLAASPMKIIQPGASIGVHSASIGGTESLQSMGMTTAFARDLGAMHVPADIIGQLVTTAPDQMNWLSISQLEEMGVRFLTSEPDQRSLSTADRFAVGAGVAPQTAPTASNPPASGPAFPVPLAIAPSAPAAAQPQAPQAFLDGMKDRKEWEAWFNSLPPDARAGANFWASQRSLSAPLPCDSQHDMTPAWESACASARARLAGSDIRRHTEPLYKAGWNAT